MIRDDATQRQIEAADPASSTWLSANAGSGKTRVLTDRVARLLLGGTKPENILCLTYTKAAASEMQNRLFKRLGEWAMMPDGKLRHALKELGDETTATTKDVRKARTLFAAAIETPGGLKIQTIHSFCSGILRRFPLEASVSPQFKEMEDRAAQLLRQDVLEAMAIDDPEAFSALTRFHTGHEIDRLLQAICGQKAQLLNAPTDQDLRRTLGMPDNQTENQLIDTIAVQNDVATIAEVIKICRSSSANDQKAVAKLNKLDLTTPLTLSDIGILEDVMLFGEKAKQAFEAKVGAFPTKKVREDNPATIEALNDLMERVEQGRQQRLRWLAYEKARALYTFGSTFLRKYEAQKTLRGALDFDDLIGKAKALLEDERVAQWVLFRLDGGVDHVLVDEAQDTSPDQWDIVRLLTQEFSTGMGAHPDRERTVFVVGDKKQSIYSFQGADPEGFDRMRDYFSAELRKIRRSLRTRSLLYSFRSSQAILSLVDQTFKGPMSDGVDSNIEHIAFNSDMPGRVDLWPAIEKLDAPEQREWDDPLDMKGQTNEKVILANQIASEMARIIDEETLPFKETGASQWSRRKITAGDFLVLVQRRSEIFDEIIAACKAKSLNVAGADRLKLGGEIAVKDISAVLRFLSLPEDDLSLAAALKSPLFGWTERQLYALAQPRPKGQTLWEALRKSGQHDATLAILNDLRRQADFLRPFDLINRLLVRHDGRRNLLARLGQEAEDGIDALQAQALSYEQSDVPSLTAFLNWLQTEDVTIKRQMDSAGDRIRVMTVHGAKGLEAPIVILPDTAKRQNTLRDEIITNDKTPIWKMRAPETPDVMAQMQANILAAQERERRRLLYVAMTRAENWLIVAAAGDVGNTYDSWHATIDVAMSHLDSVSHDASFGTISRFERHDWSAGQIKTPKTDAAPTWPHPTFDPVPPMAPDSVTIRAPSDLGGDKVLPGEADGMDTEAALAAGRIIHQLLEVLPSLPPEAQQATGHSLIMAHPDAGLIEDHPALLSEAISVLTNPRTAPYFKTGLTEVPLSATLAELGGARVYGIIDRLVVNQNDVLALDFKTNVVTPNDPQSVPSGLVRQMAAYYAALKQIYPKHRVRCAILWTKSCMISELPTDVLEHSLIDVTTA